MKIEKRDGSDERKIVTSMIVDKTVLAKIAAKWDGEAGMFANKWANLIGGWCVKYYGRYEKVPGPAIEAVFEHWSNAKKRDAATVDLVEQFLGGLSNEYKRQREECNPDFIIDLAGKVFNKVRQQRLIEKLQLNLDDGRVEDNEEALANWGKIELGLGAGIDVLQDMAATQLAFENEVETIVRFSGPFNEFYGSLFHRDSFVAFLAPEKRGKSFILLDLAWRAMLQRRRVAFFVIGDMSQDQVLHRIGCRAAKHPIKPGVVNIPTAITRGQDDPIATVTINPVTYDRGLDWRDAWKGYQRALARMRTDTSHLKLSVHPSLGVNVAGIQGMCAAWGRDGWVPDLIVIDYADNLMPPSGERDYRHAINRTWKELRSLSQVTHSCVVTATQGDAASNNVHTITRANFSEDKRKLAEVNAMIGISQTPEEKDEDILRFNILARRDANYSEHRCLHVASCRGLANPCVMACW